MERMEPNLGTTTMSSLSWLPCNKSFLKPFVLFCGITLIICAFCLRNIDNRSVHIYDRSLSRDKATNQSSSFVPKKKEEESARRPGKKIFIALRYKEQLTMATYSFLDLTALAAYGGRQVVLPFVKDSRFRGAPTVKGSETLALYYNVSALNRTIRSRGLGTLISWKEFQDVCQGKLDVLVYFDDTKITKNKKYNRTTPAFFPCNARHRSTVGDLKVERTICVNVFAVDSVEKFENEVIESLPCVGLAEWGGIRRTKFNLEAVVPDRMYFSDAAIFFSSRLLQVARDFIAKSLGPFFVSAHIRAEKILLIRNNFNNSAAVKNCISNLTTLVQGYRNTGRAPIPLFLATDFADYGSSGVRAKFAGENVKSLMKILAPLKPIIFQPSTYNLTDRGAVAIVEMNILVSGKRLFVVGGGSFQEWQVNAFLNKNNIDQRVKDKCKNAFCSRLCCL